MKATVSAKTAATALAIGRQLAQVIGFAILFLGSWGFFEVMVRWPVAAALIFAITVHCLHLWRERKLRKAVAKLRESFEEIGAATPPSGDPVDEYGNTVH